jgi:beta-galactosidase
VGTAVWNQFDFASRGRHDSRPNVNQKGLLRLDRTARDVWHLYRARLIDDEPVLHIATRDWPLRAGSLPDDARHEIAVYGNVATASLALNGEPLGSRPLDEGVARWSLALRHGDNRLVAAAAWNGQQIADAFTVRYEDRSALFSAASGVRRRDLSATLSPPDPVRMIAVNAGGSYQYVDGEGTAWEADRRYRPGEWGHVGGTAQLGHHRVRGTDEEGLFQARREGASAYRFDLADGDYEVLVRIVEMTHDSAGRRIQNVRVNGQPMFDGLDPAARYGRYRAIDRTIATTASGGSGVTIELDAVAGSTTISAIRIVAR